MATCVCGNAELVIYRQKCRFFPSFFRSDRMVGLHAGLWVLEAHGVRILRGRRVIVNEIVGLRSAPLGVPSNS